LLEFARTAPRLGHDDEQPPALKHHGQHALEHSAERRAPRAQLREEHGDKTLAACLPPRAL
jgi:hypothetical protein